MQVRRSANVAGLFKSLFQYIRRWSETKRLDVLSFVSCVSLAACFLLSQHLWVYLHASHDLGATLEFQLCSMCSHVCVHWLLPCTCTARRWLLPAVRVCVDPVETPGIYAIWQTAYGRSWWATPLKYNVCASVWRLVCVLWGRQTERSHGEALASWLNASLLLIRCSPYTVQGTWDHMSTDHMSWYFIIKISIITLL